MSDFSDKVHRAINLLKVYEHYAIDIDLFDKRGYYLGFSSGKDSVVIEALAIMAGVKFTPHYNPTTIDPPEAIAFMRKFHPEVLWSRPKRSFFRAFVESHGCPTRRVRWCCEEFKERGGEGRIKILGVRKAESVNRAKNWKEVTLWHGSGLPGTFVVAPIVDWSDDDVWRFIRDRRLPYCSLYDEGQTRIGCIGCPMAGKQREAQFARWPKYRAAWIRAFVEYYNRRKGTTKPNGGEYFVERFSSGLEFFDWWLSDNPRPQSESTHACLGMYDGAYDGDQSLMSFESE